MILLSVYCNLLSKFGILAEVSLSISQTHIRGVVCLVILVPSKILVHITWLVNWRYFLKLFFVCVLAEVWYTNMKWLF
ncbi:hypothetical protein SOVF_191200 [Spinacia oleracea]|nr:hypothetical protein SOVF_191200 [Spinacia oleracea]